MNSCPEKKFLNLYFLNLLEEDEKIKIEEHLRSCDECRKEYRIEKGIKEELSFEFDPGDIQKIVIKKFQVYKNIPKHYLFFKFIKIFLLSAASFSIFFAFLWFFLLNVSKNASGIFDSKGLFILFSFYLKEISNILNSEKLNLYYILIGLAFFIFNFLYFLIKSFFGRKYI